ncbi:DEAD/DEAH box helicase [Candidatus Bathyarchaeota archaeon]|nr:DEAD/DEAH box helicase [Candidatus Bathyarchaeota archaeon]MBT4319344.1 DEAD/DEAH box helicase [Candidatus Bathyarchaeota archaeon]MBT4424877.1 DEAD/DEAH box helicase [Candidatus Bathyarchaeota archaeon]MBT5643058.1 DEAD/DEAH box helicase [Candidatus Bathyarchaeota archaeon]MBT7186599.1 DEAD/DEAH box helicase [Candidatus Bathyarchaeota archaeon]
MKTTELDIPPQVKKIIIDRGIEELYPPQADAINTGVLDGKNLVLASPTASGKTLIAELCALKHILENDGKVLYLTPLRALTWEKFEEFQAYSSLTKLDGKKIRVGVSSGDMDNSSPWLQAYDIVICTNEKCDSLLRHRSPWMNGISLVIADEVHLIGSDRGPTLEVSLARLRQMTPDIQILALSATISNAYEIAEWLKAESVTTDWRPVTLREGVSQGNHIMFKDGDVKGTQRFHKQDPINLSLNALEEGGQVLIFVESRRRAQSTAKQASLALKKRLSKREQTELHGIGAQIGSHGEKTRLTDDLAEIITGGAAFHHAGLNRQHRKIIEDAFKNGFIKILSATPTLAAGVNLPARTVVIGNYKRFKPGYGMQPIRVMEYKQMSGRAGRPQYDTEGTALLIAKSEDEQEFLMEDYILGKPERIDSRLAQESALRGHTLAAIASDYAHSEQGLLDFFGSTFYGYNYPTAGIRLILGSLLRYLQREKMILFEGDRIKATDFGRRVSELYIDPLTAVVLRDGLKRGALDITEFTWLHLICHTPDMRPILRPRRKEIDLVENYLEDHRDEISVHMSDGYDYIDMENFLGEVKTAMVIEAWINEVSESDLLERYNVQPGDRYSAVTNGEWLLYATQEIAKILGLNEFRREISQLRTRVKHGVSKKLLPLVRLKGIGRVRAQVLFNSGFTTQAKLKRANLRQLTALPLIGPKLSKSIKEQVGGLVDEVEWKRLDNVVAAQSSLSSFVEEEYEEKQDDKQ